MFFWKSTFRNQHRFLIQFGCQSGPIFASKSTKIHPKIHSKTHHNFDRFWDRFFEVFRLQLGPNLAPKTAQEPPKIAQDRPRGAQNRPRAAQDGSQDALKTPPRPLWNLPERQEWFLMIFDGFLMDFWWILDDVASNFCRFLVKFPTSLRRKYICFPRGISWNAWFYKPYQLFNCITVSSRNQLERLILQTLCSIFRGRYLFSQKLNIGFVK